MSAHAAAQLGSGGDFQQPVGLQGLGDGADLVEVWVATE
jgi:hypothetical protein